MQNYFGELKPYDSKCCSNFVLLFGLQSTFGSFNFAVLFGSRNKGHTNIKGFTVAVEKWLSQPQCAISLTQWYSNWQL